MTGQGETATRVRFGLFEADLHTGELWKSGHRVKLQSQPFRVLAALLERPGEVLSREELHTRVWGKQAAGDFDQSLGTAINKVREALGDSADNPRFVETLSRRGYRFIAPVTVAPAASELAITLHPIDPAPVAEEVLPPAPLQSAHSPLPLNPAKASRPTQLLLLAALIAILGAVLAGYWFGSRQRLPLPRIERLTHSRRIAPGIQTMESLPTAVTDGLRIFTSQISHGRAEMAQVDVHTGEVSPFAMPSEIPSPMLGDLSPDGGSLLLRSHLSPESEQPVWIVPTAGGSALRLSNIVAHDATWMPDGKSVLYAAGNQLFVYRMQDGSTRPFASLPGRAFWMRWAPAGNLLRFTLLDPIDHTLALWQTGQDGHGATQLLAGWTQGGSPCCGAWTGDGRYFVFQANAHGSSDLWRLSGNDASDPLQITNGPLSFVAPATSHLGHRIYFIGLEIQSTLLEFDQKRATFVPEQKFLSEANRIQYSQDLAWVLWTDQQGRLWRARPDGTERIQVTPDSFEVFIAQWAPNGRQIALMAHEPGQAWSLYTVAPDGGTPVKLLSESRNEADPTWSPDAQQIAFGRITDIMGKEDGPRGIQLLDLRTHKVSPLPGSEGLFSPRWSPDGRSILAITLDQRRLMLFNVTTSTWRTLADTSVADPVWAADSKSIIFHAAQAETQPIYRVQLANGHLEELANLSNFSDGETADYFFCGLTPDGRPIVRSRLGTGDVYSLDLDAR